MRLRKNELLFFAALMFALVFLLTGIFWIYWIALFIAYPSGLASFFLWRIVRKDGRKRNVLIPLLLLIGFLLSMIVISPWIIQRVTGI